MISAFYLFVSGIAYALSPETWIGDSLSFIGTKTLKDITLPGTHDSGTYYLTDKPMPGDQSPLWEDLFKLADLVDKSVGKVAIEWGQSQDQTFYQQMTGGIRYFDLRSGWDKDSKTWVTFHFVIGSPVQYLLQNISTFLTDHPQEIVVVEMSHFEGYPSSGDISSLKAMVSTILGPFLYPVDLSFSFTIAQMVSSGKRALVTMEEGYDNQFIWPPSAIHNTYADTSDLTKMVNYNNQTVQKFMAGTWTNTLFKISWTLTPDGTCITESVLPWKPHSLIQLADHGNVALPSFYNSIQKLGWRMGNILIIDHYETSAVWNVCMKMNGLALSKIEFK
jgi:hypothetical protein